MTHHSAIAQCKGMQYLYDLDYYYFVHTHESWFRYAFSLYLLEHSMEQVFGKFSKSYCIRISYIVYFTTEPA